MTTTGKPEWPLEADRPSEAELDVLMGIMEEISNGRYSGAIMEFTQPWRNQTISRIAEAMGMMMVKVEAREFRLSQLVVDLERANERLKRNILQTVMTVAHALAARDEYTAGHAARVAEYATRMARRLKLADDEVGYIRIGAMLHDIGKIGFSDAVFKNEDTTVTPEMIEEIKRHPDLGVEIVREIDFLEPAFDAIHYHHEREDGSGYPDGLTGDQIPLAAKIIAVADCFDAITTDRPYQPGRSAEETFQILRNQAGPKLSERLVECLIEDVTELGPVQSPPAEEVQT